MFDQATGTVDKAFERERAACRLELGEIAEREARDRQRVMELARQANARGDWRSAGCSSHEQWFAQVYRTGHGTAKLITATGEALGNLPVIDEAMSTGELTFDQTVAALEFATPETEAQIAHMAVGKPPSTISREARRLNPPKVTDDRELYERRSLSMTWTRGRRELVLSGRLPLEQGAVFEQAIWDIAKQQRAAAKKHGGILNWQQSAADALVTLVQHGGAGGGVRRSPTTLIVHISDDGTPPVLEGAGPISPETAARLTCDARRLTIKPHGDDLVHSRVGRCASYPQMRALHKRSEHCQYPGCSASRELEGHHLVPVARGGRTVLENLILECPRHHKRIHDYGIRTSGTGANPIFTDADGRLITATQPHAPPS